MDSKYYQEALEDYKEQQREQAQTKEEVDQWDKRINNTGCYVENMALQLCHADTNDWRQCMKEMALFRQCWDQHGNNKRVGTVDLVDSEKK
ncbi:Cytochrome oxidase assembly factor 4 [Hanseniaspora vineae]